MMHKSDRIALFLSVIYLLVGLYTFGHSATHCVSCQNGVDRSVGALVGAMLWPLYWSWTFQDWGR